jgi:pimeloyl-ACP methyl ester carboxylesterase
MKMQQEFIEYGASLFHYHYLDRGHRLIVCFHGYDEDGQSFNILRDVVPTGYSLLAIDLPHHGKTAWDASSRFDAAVLWDLIRLICSRHNRKVVKIDLAGFSMGGRIALSVLNHRPDHIDRVILMAPDGLKKNHWYNLATGSRLGRRIFAFTVREPGWLLFTLRVANKLKLISPALFKFSWFYMKAAETRQLLYIRWVTMRWMRPEIKATRQNILGLDIPVLLIYGSFDRIMPATRGEEFCRGTNGLCKVELLPCGHQILQEKNKKNLAKIFRRLRF